MAVRLSGSELKEYCPKLSIKIDSRDEATSTVTTMGEEELYSGLEGEDESERTADEIVRSLSSRPQEVQEQVMQFAGQTYDLPFWLLMLCDGSERLKVYFHRHRDPISKVRMRGSPWSQQERECGRGSSHRSDRICCGFEHLYSVLFLLVYNSIVLFVPIIQSWCRWSAPRYSPMCAPLCAKCATMSTASSC